MAHTRETAQFHTIVFSLIKRDHCEDERCHTLYLLDAQGLPVAFEPLLDYYHSTGRTKSLAWQKEVAFSAGLFIDFLAAKDKLAASGEPAPEAAKSDPASLFALLGRDIGRGTIGADGRDPLKLYW